MSRYKIITVSGLDRVGKETQSKLLSHVLQPSRRMSFPDYGHWGGQLVRAILNEEPFSLSRGDTFSAVFNQKKEPRIFQCLQAVDRLHHQENIEKGLHRHHWIMDRYDVDALAYGLVDGCELDWLLSMHRLYRPTDLALVFLGEPIPRPEEEADLYERDTEFQSRVWAAYEALATLFPDLLHLVYVDKARNLEDPIQGIMSLHDHLREVLEERLGVQTDKLSEGQIRQILTEGDLR